MEFSFAVCNENNEIKQIFHSYLFNWKDDWHKRMKLLSKRIFYLQSAIISNEPAQEVYELHEMRKLNF